MCVAVQPCSHQIFLWVLQFKCINSTFRLPSTIGLGKGCLYCDISQYYVVFQMLWDLQNAFYLSEVNRNFHRTLLSLPEVFLVIRSIHLYLSSFNPLIIRRTCQFSLGSSYFLCGTDMFIVHQSSIIYVYLSTYLSVIYLIYFCYITTIQLTPSSGERKITVNDI